MTDHKPLLLRPARPEDEFTFRRMIRENRINPMGVHWQNFSVIESPQGEIIAIGQIKQHFDGTSELSSLVVDEAWRGQGLARRMMEHLIASHTGPLYLTCRSELGSMYEKFGFRRLPHAEYTPYFKRLARFARLMEKLAGVEMLVMLREPDVSGAGP